MLPTRFENTGVILRMYIKYLFKKMFHKPSTFIPAVTMSVEGVMVSYNYSEDGEHSNIITVSSSGMKFSNRWVLTHGSLLSPLKQAHAIKHARGNPILKEEFYDNLPEIYVTCETEGSELHNVERLGRERNDDLDHSSYQIRVLTGRYLFP